MPARVGVIGLGLMGGSLLRRCAAVGRPAAGWDVAGGTVAAVVAAGLAAAPTLEQLVAASDVLFVAVPLPALDATFTAVAAMNGAGPAPAGPVVTDLTSVKQPVRELAAGHGLTFVGGHPMAGSELSGFAASSAELLAGAAWVLTLDDGTSLAGWLAVAEILTSIGCRVVPCTSADHDRAVARVSHVPHLLAAAVAAGAAGDPLALALGSGSFRDATRVAASRPELLAAMCCGNAGAVRAELAALMGGLKQAAGLFGDPSLLTGWFELGRTVRAGWPPAPGAGVEIAVDGELRQQLLALGRGGGHLTGVGADRLTGRAGPETGGGNN
ncbi:MAG: prephenate dehydrogenase/arogenate dehydrogenase family protein [Actinomycetota bacterium]|nr:prephenate dehydrogenase/arogenate dehydrogenase family protein [Actinomycetota bacterium]